MPRINLGISSVRLALFLQPRKNQESRRPLQILTDSQPAVSGFGRSMPPGTLLTLRSLRHLPPSIHSASVTPAPILFTICTQKPGQPQTMYLICTHAICTRARKTKPAPKPPPFSIPAKCRKPMQHTVCNNRLFQKYNRFYQNKCGKNREKCKIISTEKVPRIPHIYILNTYELFAGLTNL